MTRIVTPKPSMIVLLTGLSFILAGCRTPWQGQRSSEPNFDRLIEIEERSESSARSPLSRKSRPGIPGGDDKKLTTNSPPNPPKDGPLPSDVLQSDEEYVAAYSESSPEDRKLLDRFRQDLAQGIQTPSDALKSRTPGIPEKSSAPRSRSEAPNESQQAVTYKLSDVEDPSDPPLPAATQHALVKGEDIQESQSSVVLASSASPLPDQAPLRDLAHAVIKQLQDAEKLATNPDEKIDLAKKRRLVNLVLDDLESAQEPIEGLQTAAQDYILHTFQGLHDATDIDGNPVPSRRFTLAMQSQRKAIESLSTLANLEVVNVAFCTEVDSFGVISKFQQYHFQADQEVLLYCELENFFSEAVRGGFETRLQGNYEILDANGRRIADQLLPEDSDMCGNKRDDFYIAYRLHLPEKIEPGRHQLKLTIEDMKGHKFGQATIDFHITR